MPAILSAIIGILTGKAGESIGGTVAKVTELGAILAAIGPAAYWIAGHKDETFITLSYGDLSFWAVILFVLVRLVHRAPPPGQS